MQFINFLVALLCAKRTCPLFPPPVRPSYNGLLSQTDRQTDITTGLRSASFAYTGGPGRIDLLRPAEHHSTWTPR